MQTEVETEVKIELKYCERCGGLWLRRAGDPEPYCAACAPDMHQMVAPTKPMGRARLPRATAEFGGAACA